MDTTTFLWTMSATLFAGIQIFYQKVAAQEKRDSALNGMLMYGLSGLVAFAVLMTSYGLPEQWRYAAFFAVVAGAVHALGNFMRIEALKYIDSVIFFPLNKVLGPIVVVIGGLWLFGDPLTLKEYIGIALSLCVPLLLISSAEKRRQSDLRVGLWLLLFSTILTSAAMLVTKQGLAYDASALLIMAISQLGGVTTSALLYFKKRDSHTTRIIDITYADVRLGVISGALGFISFYSLLKAFSTGLVSIVYVIHAHYILVPIILSIWWYGEHINARKLIAIVVSSLAITLLV